MSAVESKFAIRNVTPTTTTWVELTAPIKCNYVSIVNQATVDILFRTDSTKATSQITIPATLSYDVLAPTSSDPRFAAPRFIAGNTIGYVQLSASGSGNVAGVFTF